MRLQLATLALAAALAATPSPAQDPNTVADLPLTEVPARGPSSGTLVVMLSGDGGWVALDKQMADAFAAKGIGVVGLDARSYLGKRKTPEQSAADVARIAHAYLPRWNADRLVLVGYSRGATMIPFVATRLPADLKPRVALLAMLGLETTANFQFHWVDMVSDVKRPDDLPVPPELERLRGTRMLCIYGEDETDSACKAADPALITRVGLAGAHHFDGDYPGLARIVMDALPKR